jgi:predicted AAA+ superfamily ATPase
MERYLEEQIRRDMAKKIIILSGPRQVGKTTLSRQLVPSFVYLNYDAASDRRMIHEEDWPRDVPLVIFDELHKLKNWKSKIKGIFDTDGIPPSLLITGSARLETARKGGDSLAGRFFAYRLHPLTLKEIVHFLKQPPAAALERMLKLGGFPEPYLEDDETYAKRWRRTHLDTLIRGDLLDLERVRDLKSIEILIDLLRTRVGSPTSYSSLAQDLQVSVHTVKHWLQILENLCVIFGVRPYHRNIARSLLKEPKYYFYDTGAVEGDMGARLENTVALALLREMHLLEDTTGSRMALHYLRDRDGREVDFLVLVDRKPVIIAEVKASDDAFAKPLRHFGRYMPTARKVQIVLALKRSREKEGVSMISAQEFLAGLTLA